MREELMEQLACILADTGTANEATILNRIEYLLDKEVGHIYQELDKLRRINKHLDKQLSNIYWERSSDRIMGS